MLKSLRVDNFRTFKQFTVSFGNGAYMVGPNNAGKTTILTALRIVDVALRFANSRNPTLTRSVDGVARVCYPLNLSEFPALADSVRHEFGDLESRVALTFRSGASVTLLWPSGDGDQGAAPFFFLESMEGVQIRGKAQVKAAFPDLGVIPILGPVEHTERVLDQGYVRSNVSGRLSSRHYRNQLRLMKKAGELDDLLTWAEQWLHEIQFESLQEHYEGESGGVVIDAFFSERTSRVPKELAWAGDGLQVWVQLVSHVYRVRNCETIVLDEPEVYLHPDLQRRLVRMLESTGRQIVLATHSAELISESDARLTMLIDKTRKSGQRPKTEADLERMSGMLGTAFNLRLARALKSRVVVFFEGKDAAILRRLARTIDCPAVANEQGVTVIELTGYTHWGEIAPFAWITRELLPEVLTTFVILDRDYRPDAVVANVEQKFASDGIDAHVWRRKEVESYLLSESAMSRASGAPLTMVETLLEEALETFKHDVFARLLWERESAEKGAHRHAVNITQEFSKEFEKAWLRKDFRRQYAPPKKVLSELNSRLQADGYKPMSTTGLARVLRRSEIPDEVQDVLRRIESAAGG